MTMLLLANLCRSALQIAVSLWLQSAVILVCGLAAAQLARRRGPLRRASLLQAALVAAALGMVGAVLTTGHVQPLWRVTLPALAAEGMSAGLPAPPTPEPIPASSPVVPSAAPSPGHPAAPQTTPRPLLPPTLPGRVYVIIVGIWLGGTVLLLLWLLFCQAYLSRLRCRSALVADPAATDMAAQAASALNVRPLPLIAVPSVRSPFLAGLRRPAIFLPPSWNTDYDAATLHVILAHETAHHRRRDLWWTLLLRLTTALLWPQPLLWLLGRHLEHAAEEACDLLAVTPDLSARRYADCLLALADRPMPPLAERTLAQGVVPVRSALGRRIQTLLDRRNHTMKTFSPRARAGLAVAAVACACTALRLVSAADTPQQTQQQAQVQQMQAKQITSASNLKQLGLACIIYAQNHGDRLPDADRWMDELTPVLTPLRTQSAQTDAERQETLRSLFHAPGGPAGNVYSYAYNPALSGVALSTIKDPAHTVLLFESTKGTRNASDTGQSLPHPGWYNGLVNVCFANGFVKAMPDTQAATLSFQPTASPLKASQLGKATGNTSLQTRLKITGDNAQMHLLLLGSEQKLYAIERKVYATTMAKTTATNQKMAQTEATLHILTQQPRPDVPRLLAAQQRVDKLKIQSQDNFTNLRVLGRDLPLLERRINHEKAVIAILEQRDHSSNS